MTEVTPLAELDIRDGSGSHGLIRFGRVAATVGRQDHVVVRRSRDGLWFSRARVRDVERGPAICRAASAS
jgi:hypothetical protein